MLDKERTVKRAMRKIGINYVNNTGNKRTIEEEAFDIFDDIILDVMANKNFTFNAKTIVLTRAPDDPILSARGLYMRRYFIPNDLLNIIEGNIEDLEFDNGFLVTRQENYYEDGIDLSELTEGSDTAWIRYCRNGDHSLVPFYFSDYVSYKLAYELALIYKPSDGGKLKLLDEKCRENLIMIDRTQMSNRPTTIDGGLHNNLARIRGRR